MYDVNGRVVVVSDSGNATAAAIELTAKLTVQSTDSTSLRLKVVSSVRYIDIVSSYYYYYLLIES